MCHLENQTFKCVSTDDCVNFSVVCDGFDNCADGSDESFTHAHCYDLYKGDHKKAIIEIIAIVVGCIVAIAILCCILGTVLECAAHVYKYWCPACVHRAFGRGKGGSSGGGGGQSSTQQLPMTSLAAPCGIGRPGEAIVLFVKALPPHYSTVFVSPIASSSSIADQSSSISDSSSTTMTGDPSLPQDCQQAPSVHLSRHLHPIGPRGRQLYHVTRTRRHSSHMARVGHGRIGSRGFDHVILPSRDSDHATSVSVGSSESTTASMTSNTITRHDSSAIFSNFERTNRVSDTDHVVSERDIERLLLTGEYVAYRLIRTRQEVETTQVNTGSTVPSLQPDIVSDIGGGVGTSIMSAWRQQTIVMCNERNGSCHMIGCGHAPSCGHAPACHHDLMPPPYSSICMNSPFRTRHPE